MLLTERRLDLFVVGMLLTERRFECHLNIDPVSLFEGEGANQFHACGRTFARNYAPSLTSH